MKGEGKSASKGDTAKGATFDGHVHGADGTDIVFETVESTLRVCKKEVHQVKVKAMERVILEKETSARTMSSAVFDKESLEEKDGKVVTKISLEVTMSLNRYHFNRNTSQCFHS